MSEFSRLTEVTPEHLKSDAWTYSIIIRDGTGARSAGEIHLPTEIKNPFDLDLGQFIPNPPVRLEGLIDLLGQVIADAQVREGVVESQRIKLAQEYQPELFAELGGEEIITFKVIKREPAKMSRDGKSRPNRGWTYSHEYANPQEPNKYLCVEERPIDHIIELAAWGKTSTLANRRALWLERLMIGQRWAFTSKGVKPFYWIGRGADTTWTPSSVRLHQRPLQFSARLYEYTVLAYPTLREFELELKTDTAL